MSHWLHPPVPLRLTAFLPYHVLQITPINSNYTQLCLGTPSPLVHRKRPEHSSECTPSALGMQIPSEIMWPSCDNHATMHHLGHLIGRPPSWWTWDLRVPTLFIFNLFPSYCMLILLWLLCSGYTCKPKSLNYNIRICHHFWARSTTLITSSSLLQQKVSKIKNIFQGIYWIFLTCTNLEVKFLCWCFIFESRWRSFGLEWLHNQHYEI